MTQPTLAFDTPMGRFYRHPITGEEFPSVTTVLGCLAKPKLDAWRMRQVAKTVTTHAVAIPDMIERLGVAEVQRRLIASADRDAEVAAMVGDIVHRYAELVGTGQAPEAALAELPPRAQSLIESWEGFVNLWRPRILFSELTVFNRSVGYAGTADLVAEIGGEVFLADYKTSRHLHSEVALQLNALAHAEEAVIDGAVVPMPEVEALAAIHIAEDSHSVVRFDYDDALFGVFQALLRAFPAVRGLEDAGKAMRPPRLAAVAS